jgi:hypothetical protein
VPVDVRLLDPLVAREVGAPEGTALLVRPDGKPAGSGSRRFLSRLEHALEVVEGLAPTVSVRADGLLVP